MEGRWPKSVLTYNDIPIRKTDRDRSYITVIPKYAASAILKKEVSHYSDLVRLVAELSSVNGVYDLYYRGQTKDYQVEEKKSRSKLQPTLWRDSNFTRKNIEVLNYAAMRLRSVARDCYGCHLLSKNELRELENDPLACWALLQHYDICPTPLLDITKSLQVACSFALYESQEEFGYVYVLAFPYLTQKITINWPSNVAIMRLQSIAPIIASRPIFQDGYLATCGDWWRLLQPENYPFKRSWNFDFYKRLLCKFKIRNSPDFWDLDSVKSLETDLFPDNDIFNHWADSVSQMISPITPAL